MSNRLENHWFKHDMNASTDNKIRRNIKLLFTEP